MTFIESTGRPFAIHIRAAAASTMTNLPLAGIERTLQVRGGPNYRHLAAGLGDRRIRSPA
jgi:hypothetical protein